MNKEVEDLGLNSYKVSSPPQLAAIRVERTLLKQITQYFVPLVTGRPRGDPSTRPAKEKWRER